jgi:molybdate transport system ATP-binding protein
MADLLSVDIEKRFASGACVTAAFQAPIDRGTVLVLFGPSGAGKTTILRCLAGLERPDRGEMRFRDQVWFDARSGRFVPPQARRTSYVFQEPALFPHLTVRANVGFGVARRSAEASRYDPRSAEASRYDASGGDASLKRSARLQPSGSVDDLLARLGVAELADRYPRELSGGQRQRVALARALAPEPDLLLLDEPFGALDAPARGRLRGDLRALVTQSGSAAVLVTHDRTDALAIGDQIAMLAGGRIRQVGPVADVMRRPADLDVARSVGVETVVPATVDGLANLRVAGQLLRAVGTTAEPIGARVFVCIRAEDVALDTSAAASGSARNHLTGRVIAIEAEGAVDRVRLDCGFELVALITHEAREQLGLTGGSAVSASIKATSIHVVPRAGEGGP